MYLKIKDNRITNEISVMNFKNILLSSDQHIDLQPSTCIVRSSGCDLKKTKSVGIVVFNMSYFCFTSNLI